MSFDINLNFINNYKSYFKLLYTWANLPYRAVWKSGHRTAKVGSLNHTFFVDSNCRPWQFHGHVLKLPTLAVSWPVFSTLGLLVLKLPTLAVSWPLFSHLPYPWRDWCSQTADLGSFMAGFQHCDLKLPTLAVSWPVFSTPVALALKLPTLAVSWPLFSPYQKWPWNCWPWQFYGHWFSREKCGHETADLGSFMATCDCYTIFLFFKAVNQAQGVGRISF